jgi:hypothetical protein
MLNLTLFTSSLIFASVHVFFIVNSSNINLFYALILLRACLSSIYTHVSTSKFIQLYDMTVMVESLVVDLFFMVETGTLDSSGPPILLALMLYISSRTCLLTYKEITPFTDVLHVGAQLCNTIGHIIIIVST